MIIDFHTHVFPDAIAQRTIAHLEEKGGMKAHAEGTLAGLKSSMKWAGIDYSVVLPVVTKPSQFESVNRYAAEINGKEGIFSFGGIHPDCEDIEEKLDTIKSLGLKGIKLHPDYQDTEFDDEKYFRILEGCKKRGLYVLTHAGFDPAYPSHTHLTPENAAQVVKALHEGEENPKPFLILAHLGSNDFADRSEEHLVGLPCYFDLAVILGKVPQDQLLRVIRAHGKDKILFATDSPWHCQSEDKAYFDALPLSAEERESIGYKNGAEILGITI